MDRKLVAKLLGISEKSYYRWRKDRPIFDFLEKYFNDEDIESYFEKGTVPKMQMINVSNLYLDEVLELMIRRVALLDYERDIFEKVLKYTLKKYKNDEITAFSIFEEKTGKIAEEEHNEKIIFYHYVGGKEEELIKDIQIFLKSKKINVIKKDIARYITKTIETVLESSIYEIEFVLTKY